MLKLFVLLTLVLSVFASVPAHAIPPLEIEAQPIPSKSPLSARKLGTPATPDELLGTMSLYCSGALVELNRKETEKAVFLTNGHCARKPLLKASEVVVNIPYTRSAIYLWTSSGMIEVRPSKVLYATMTKTDLALIELADTYADLKKKGAKVYTIANHPAAAGDNIRIVSGYWKEKQVCAVDYTVPELDEGVWVWKDSIALKMDCEVRGGYSGSPIFDQKTDQIVGVINTGNESGQLCTLNNPCEKDPSGQSRAFKDKAYGQRVDLVLGCITTAGKVNLKLPNCGLPH